jgi:O-6-methylguanine DNA methyltransferase
MTRPIRLPVTDDAAGSLARLAVPAPVHVPEHVLVEVGLADRMGPMPSPLGTLWVAWNGRGVCEVELADDGPAAAARHEARTGRRTTLTDALPQPLADAIARRLAGERRVRIPLDLRGRTAFEVAVWTKALEIPRGEVRPYGWIAAEIGRPKAVRAVGTALGHNPVPLIVPCHRVVRTDGSIGQYSLGGPRNKRVILASEGLDPGALEASARRGERLLASATTRIVCWPTCRNAKRIEARNRVPFRSLSDATAAGYRACRVCRPAAVEAAA